MKLKIVTILTGCAFAAALQCHAVDVSLSSVAPTQNVLKFNEVTTGTPANINSYWRPAGGTDEQKNIGQGFSTTGLTSNYLLTAVTFNLLAFSVPVEGLGFNISICESTSVSAVPSPATLVSSQNGSLPDILSNGYITFTLDTPVTLLSNKIYNVMYSFTELTSTTTTPNSLSFKTIGDVTNTTGGRRWIDSDGSYSSSPSNGFVFYAQATAIPEPSTYLLLGVGAVALVIFRKRRHA